jgi:hypothetical protein
MVKDEVDDRRVAEGCERSGAAADGDADDGENA